MKKLFMETKKIIPDYFIEIYNNNIGDSQYTDYVSFKHLEKYLKFTKNIGLKTIAIFKIKLK